MVKFSDESNTSSIVLKKSESKMFVYEFMSYGVLNELLVQENLVGVEDDDDDGFIELDPSLDFEEVYDDGDGSDDGSDDDDEYDHSDVIEKLKTEIRTARTGGLCTILEESETLLEDVKPLKIESKSDQIKDRISEIRKVYKNYAIKMRKLDIIDSQTLHSISKTFLQNL